MLSDLKLRSLGLGKIKFSNINHILIANCNLPSSLQHMGGFFLVLSETLEVLYTSANIEKFTGLTQADVMAKPLLKHVHYEDHVKLKHFLSRQKNNLPPKEEDAGARFSPVGNDVPASPAASSAGSPVTGPENGRKRQNGKVGKRQFFHFRYLIKQKYAHVNFMGHYRKIGKYFIIGGTGRDFLVSEAEN